MSIRRVPLSSPLPGPGHRSLDWTGRPGAGTRSADFPASERRTREAENMKSFLSICGL